MQKTNLQNTKKTILIAHSPDADDAFMFYALSNNFVDHEKFNFEHVLKDIQTLNIESVKQKYDVQAISFFAYPDIEDEYQLLSCGGSVGYGYGPVLIANEEGKDIFFKQGLNGLKDKSIAIPGEQTTAYLLLNLLVTGFNSVHVPFDEVLQTVKKGDCQFGLVIHEGQLSYGNYGLHKIVDLGEWWLGKTNLPTPLGGNVIKRSYSKQEKSEINSLIRKSIDYAIRNKDKVIPAVSKYARELSDNYNLVEKFVLMYVNEFTLDYGYLGKLAIKKLYQLAFSNGLISNMPKLDFVE